MSAQVFVGNIPYDATEQELEQVFAQAGPVISFRLVFDRQTGKPKGFGFCEYRDEATAQSALRNLAGVEFHGRRLRVDYAESAQRSGMGGDFRDDSSRGPNKASVGGGMQLQPQQQPVQGMMGGMSERQAHAMDYAAMDQQSVGGGGGGSSAVAAGGIEATPESVQSVLSELDNAQLYEIVSKARMLVQQQPEAARQILAASPVLAYSLIQAQSMLGIISIDAVTQVLSSGSAVPAQGGPPPGGMPPQDIYGGSMPQGQMPPAAAVPSQQQTGYPGPQPGVAGADALPAEQQALLQQVMSMTEAQIMVLPPDQQQQVLQLRATLLQQ